MSASVGTIYNLLGGRETLPNNPVRSYRDLLGLVRTGIPKVAVTYFATSIAAKTALTNAQVRNFIVAEPTFRRNDLFKNATAEKLLRLANLRARAEEIIGTEDGANEFLFRPHPELEDESPFECAQTEMGARAAEEILERAAYGLPV
ncbi:MAG: antitoxin Xre/MbcA/ParS toxin-binding domain-containing protein [Kordiimonas sp.]